MVEPRFGPIYGKIWGSTQVVFEWNNIEINRLLPIKGSFCSEHKHHSKYSRFLVLRGKLRVKIFREHGLAGRAFVDTIDLGPGRSTDIPPGVWHQFEVLEDDTDAIEIYWVVLDAGDIERRSEGGKHGD